MHPRKFAELPGDHHAHHGEQPAIGAGDLKQQQLLGQQIQKAEEAEEGTSLEICDNVIRELVVRKTSDVCQVRYPMGLRML